MCHASIVRCLIPILAVFLTAGCASTEPSKKQQPESTAAESSQPTAGQLVDRAVPWMAGDTRVVVASRDPGEAAVQLQAMGRLFLAGTKSRQLEGGEIEESLSASFSEVYAGELPAAVSETLGEGGLRVDSFVAGFGGSWQTVLLTGRFPELDLPVADEVRGRKVHELAISKVCEWPLDPLRHGFFLSPDDCHEDKDRSVYLASLEPSSERLMVSSSVDGITSMLEAREGRGEPPLVASGRASAFRNLVSGAKAASTSLAYVSGEEKSAEDGGLHRMSASVGELARVSFVGPSETLEAIRARVADIREELGGEPGMFTPTQLETTFERMERTLEEDELTYRVDLEGEGTTVLRAFEIPRHELTRMFARNLGRGMSEAYPHQKD